MVNTTSEDIIADPRAAITRLVGEGSPGLFLMVDARCKDAKKPDMSSDFHIPQTFEAVFADPAQMQKIPRLDKLSASSLITGKLVRFLGMVQDTSYSQEIYVGATRKDNKWTCHRYETANIDLDINSPDAVLEERTGMYVTSIPGAAKWLGPADSLEMLSLEDPPVILKGDKDRVVSLGQQKIGLVVKCYSGIENSVKVCDLVEIVGILEMPEELEDNNDVVIHAITLKKKQLYEVVLSNGQQLSPPNMTKAKDIFIQHLTRLYEGDDLAAQSILLNLTSSLTHRNPIPLGSLPMNIYSTPAAVTATVISFLQSILPAVAIEKLSIETLNKDRIFPRSDGEKLSAGRGQVVSRTTLIIDESNMQEGKLLDTGSIPKKVWADRGCLGVRNLRFLSRIAAGQKLGFEFPYHEFDIETDISFLVLGDSKSIFPVSIAFPHVKCESAEASTLSSEDTKAIQTYLAQLSTLKTVAINESIAEEMQSSFVKARKDTGSEDVDETWFGTRIVVAKSLARINTREKMDREDWRESLRICAQWEGRRKVLNGM